jgi:hypothetical protein
VIRTCHLSQGRRERIGGAGANCRSGLRACPAENAVTPWRETALDALNAA